MHLYVYRLLYINISQVFLELLLGISFLWFALCCFGHSREVSISTAFRYLKSQTFSLEVLEMKTRTRNCVS